MGKMKGNRLNTAANVGTFVTSRQQLHLQQLLTAQGAIQAELAAAQLDQMRRQKMADHYAAICQWADGEFHAGRKSKEEAEAFVAQYWFNFLTPPPKPSALITVGLGQAFDAALSGGTPRPGWYDERNGSLHQWGTARYWDGQQWTLNAVSVQEARNIVSSRIKERQAGRLASGSRSRPARGQLPAAGWYPTEAEGVLGYWDGQAWSGETRPV
ncbi:DUF2510 domain-containing protein [Pseudarthrobacter sp. Fe7]|nr:DUF2510 domain-containing protein [Pseudarthrobacter sp. Fe7]